MDEELQRLDRIGEINVSMAKLNDFSVSLKDQSLLHEDRVKEFKENI